MTLMIFTNTYTDSRLSDSITKTSTPGALSNNMATRILFTCFMRMKHVGRGSRYFSNTDIVINPSHIVSLTNYISLRISTLAIHFKSI